MPNGARLLRAVLVALLLSIAFPQIALGAYEAQWRQLLLSYFSEEQVNFILQHWGDPDRVYFLLDKYGRQWMVGQGYIPLQPVPIAGAYALCEDFLSEFDFESKIDYRGLYSFAAWGGVSNYYGTNPSVYWGSNGNLRRAERQLPSPFFDLAADSDTLIDSDGDGVGDTPAVSASLDYKRIYYILSPIQDGFKIYYEMTVEYKMALRIQTSNSQSFYFVLLQIDNYYYNSGVWIYPGFNIQVNILSFESRDAMATYGYKAEDISRFRDGIPDQWYIYIQHPLQGPATKSNTVTIKFEIIVTDPSGCQWGQNKTETVEYVDPTSSAGGQTLYQACATTGIEPIAVNATIGAQADSEQSMILFENPYFDWSALGLTKYHGIDPNLDELYSIKVLWGWIPSAQASDAALCNPSNTQYELAVSEYTWSFNLPQYDNAEATEVKTYLPSSPGSYYFIYVVVVDVTPSEKYIYIYRTPTAIDVTGGQVNAFTKAIMEGMRLIVAPIVGALKTGLKATLSFAWDMLPPQFQDVLNFFKVLLVDVGLALISFVTNAPWLLDTVKLTVQLLPLVAIIIIAYNPLSAFTLLSRIVRFVSQLVQAIRSVLPLP